MILFNSVFFDTGISNPCFRLIRTRVGIAIFNDINLFCIYSFELLLSFVTITQVLESSWKFFKFFFEVINDTKLPPLIQKYNLVSAINVVNGQQSLHEIYFLPTFSCSEIFKFSSNWFSQGPKKPLERHVRSPRFAPLPCEAEACHVHLVYQAASSFSWFHFCAQLNSNGSIFRWGTLRSHCSAGSAVALRVFESGSLLWRLGFTSWNR